MSILICTVLEVTYHPVVDKHLPSWCRLRNDSVFNRYLKIYIQVVLSSCVCFNTRQSQESSDVCNCFRSLSFNQTELFLRWLRSTFHLFQMLTKPSLIEVDGIYRNIWSYISNQFKPLQYVSYSENTIIFFLLKPTAYSLKFHSFMWLKVSLSICQHG